MRKANSEQLYQTVESAFNVARKGFIFFIFDNEITMVLGFFSDKKYLLFSERVRCSVYVKPVPNKRGQQWAHCIKTAKCSQCVVIKIIKNKTLVCLPRKNREW